MARAAAISPASVQRLWAASDIKPHLSRTFKLSNDKRFEEKFWDVIGHPPDKALVLCCDEKSQCQALERTQPGLPLGIGHVRTKNSVVSCSKNSEHSNASITTADLASTTLRSRCDEALDGEVAFAIEATSRREYCRSRRCCRAMLSTR